jgi:predicted outer membrane repeat protein
MKLHRLIQQIRFIMLIAAFPLLAAAASPASASVCTLADHIRAANTNSAVGFCPAGTSHDIITIAKDITLREPLPPITGTITIEGGGHTISGGESFPIFVVKGGWLAVNNLTLTEGYFEGSWEKGWAAAGGIQVRNGGTLQVNDSVFINNRSGRGHGGAIAVDRGTLSVNNSSFIKNRSKGQGGAIYVWDSLATITNSAFVDNQTRGILARGGGVYTGFRSRLEISNSTFTRNFASDGGAVGTDYTSHGPASTKLTHVTMMDNRAINGDSIFIDPKDRSFNLRNSIIASNGISNVSGQFNQNIGNLFFGSANSSAASRDALVADVTGAPAYFPLQDGSPALDAADAKFCPASDQIGTPRPQGGGCDIGAIESMTAIPAPTPVATLCTLPDQIIAANTDSAYKACPAGNGADTIFMIRDYVLSEPLPGITSEITIEGNGHTISANKRFHIIDVDGGKLTIQDVTLTEGKGSRGGAIRLHNGASVTATNVIFKRNEATAGGAVATESARDQLTIEGSSFVENSALTIGGALLVDGGQATVSRSAFTTNQASEKGGAIAATQGQATIANSTMHRNQAQRGGAVYVRGAEATLTHLTMMRNIAERLVGAGIFAEWGELRLRNSIVGGSGNGIDCFGSLQQSRGNLSQDGTCSNSDRGDPQLGDPLGSPAYYPLLDASPAHGTGDPDFCLPTDQLGNPRAHCDIGAVETARDPNYAPASKQSLPDDCTLADQIIAANTDQPTGNCPAGDGADTITLSGSIALAEALPAIKSDITIDGNGHTLDGNSGAPIFVIDGGAVVIKNLTLLNGSNPDGKGGAISLRQSAELTVANVHFRDNRARYGGAIAATESTVLNVFDSEFVDNAAEIKGGSIWNDGECSIIDNNQFRGSRAGAPAAKQDEGRVQMIAHLDGAARQCAADVTNFYTDA